MRPAPPAWWPHRPELQNDQPGNPLVGPDGDMRPPPWNPGGLQPGPVFTLGASKWEARENQNFVVSGQNRVWSVKTPTFDLRPEWKTNDQLMTSGFPVNHSGLLGLNVYVNFLLANPGGAAPALLFGLTASYTEYGNNTDTTQLFQLHPAIDCTDQIRAGGTSVVAPFGCSIIQVYAPIGLRFWQVELTFQFEGVGAVSLPMFIQGATN